MRKSVLEVLVVLVLLIGSMMIITVTAATAAEEKGTMVTATGKVMNVDPQGKAITISAKVGKQTKDIGAIVDDHTVVKIKGKKASLSDIKPGDTVTLRYLRTDNLYAKEIVKE